MYGMVWVGPRHHINNYLLVYKYTMTMLAMMSKRTRTLCPDDDDE